MPLRIQSKVCVYSAFLQASTVENISFAYMRTRKSRSLANQAEADAGVDMARTKKQPAGKKRQLTQLYNSIDAKKLRPSLSRPSEEPERDPEGETCNGDAGIVQPVEGPPARVAGSSRRFQGQKMP